MSERPKGTHFDCDKDCGAFTNDKIEIVIGSAHMDTNDVIKEGTEVMNKMAEDIALFWLRNGHEILDRLERSQVALKLALDELEGFGCRIEVIRAVDGALNPKEE